MVQWQFCSQQKNKENLKKKIFTNIRDQILGRLPSVLLKKTFNTL